jgi:hypothetical protein
VSVFVFLEYLLYKRDARRRVVRLQQPVAQTAISSQAGRKKCKKCSLMYTIMWPFLGVHGKLYERPG